MEDTDKKLKLFAMVISDIRRSLAHRLGLGNINPEYLREGKAAHLAYAIHNEASAILAGKDFDLDAALEKFKPLVAPFDDDVYERYKESLKGA